MPPKKQTPPVQQTAIGDGNIQVAGDNNTVNVNQTLIQKVSNFFTGDIEQQRALRNRRAMLELVKNTWIKGGLEKSLYNEILIELGMEERPEALDHPWDIQVQMPDRPNRTLSPEITMIDIYDETNRAMLILGEPGSGKTTMLLELARDCITRAEQDVNQPIPVVLNLSSWDGKQTIVDWLINELRIKYNAPKKTAQDWVMNDDLQLLLDGLDEVKQEYREACIKAINDFHQQHGLATPMVVCSRIADYDTLKSKLSLSMAVVLQPLLPDQIEQYFQQAGSNLEGVHEILKKDQALYELVKQPLMLSILTLAYQGKSVDTVVSGNFETDDDRRRQLFDTYIQMMFERVARTRGELYSPEQTKNWLTWLAWSMKSNGQTSFLLERLEFILNPEPRNILRKIIAFSFFIPLVCVIGGLWGEIFSLQFGIIAALCIPLIYQVDDGQNDVEKKYLNGNNSPVTFVLWKALPGLVFGLVIGYILIGAFWGGMAFALSYGVVWGITLRSKNMPDTFVFWEALLGSVLGFAIGYLLELSFFGGMMFVMLYGVVWGINLALKNMTNMNVFWKALPGLVFGFFIGNMFLGTFLGEMVCALSYGIVWGTTLSRKNMTDTNVFWKAFPGAILGFFIGYISFGSSFLAGMIFALYNEIVWDINLHRKNTSGMKHKIFKSGDNFFGNHFEWLNKRLRFRIRTPKGYDGRLEQPTERLQWSWRRSLRGVEVGMLVGFITTLILAVITGLIYAFPLGDLPEYGLNFGFLMGFGYGLLAGGFIMPFLGLIGALFYGLNKKEMDMRTMPNQGIRQSIINSAIVVLMIGGIFGLLGGVIWPVLFFSQTSPSIPGNIDILTPVIYGMGIGFLIGILLGSFFSIYYGGYAAIYHYSLRLILYHSSNTPWNYIRFLDYCVDRIFLRRVGGGYIFVHRLLMEHFADMYPVDEK